MTVDALVYCANGLQGQAIAKELRRAGLSVRALTLIDPDTLQSGKEPLRTLARHRRRDGTTWFGMRVVPENHGILSLGDPVSW